MKKESGYNGKKLNNIIMILFVGILAVALTVVVILAVRKNTEASSADSTEESANTEAGTEEPEKWQEGTISYNGKHYRYNNQIKTYLFMGIDKDAPVCAAPDRISGGQSDSLFLLVQNAKEETLSIVAINRNAMTQIDACDEEGNALGQITAQICLQHGYGDGMEISCRASVEAVSRLFRNLPIHGYLALNMGAIPQMNDAVGGVTVEVMNDLENQGLGVSLKQGDAVTLTGDEAYVYLRQRDINEFGSATLRLERQKQYLTGFMAKAKQVAGEDQSSVLRIYDSVEDYLVTNIDFVSLVGEALEYRFDESLMYTVPGETVMGEVYEEFYVDEDALYQMILDVFYEEVEAVQ